MKYGDTLASHYDMVKELYGNDTAARTGIPLINHINEGLVLLDSFLEHYRVKSAFCIHPIIQSDAALKQELIDQRLKDARPDIVMLAMEYRVIANSYLADGSPRSGCLYNMDTIPEVRSMLIADKIQNQKDFRANKVKFTDERVEQLETYFDNWLSILDVPTFNQRIYTKLISR